MVTPKSDSFIMRNRALESVASMPKEKNGLVDAVRNLGVGVAATLAVLHGSAVSLGATAQAERVAGISNTAAGVFASAMDPVGGTSGLQVTGPTRGRGHTGAVSSPRYEL